MAIGLKMVNGDFVIDHSGRLKFVSGVEKCSRDFYKFLVTSKDMSGLDEIEDGLGRYNPNYGTALKYAELYQGLSRAAVRDVVIMLLNESISYYISLQESRNNLDVDEIITGVDFDVYYDKEDARRLIIKIQATTLSGAVLNMGEFMQNIV